MSTRAIVTMYEGEAAQLRPLTLPALERYAARHGYTVEHAKPVPGLPYQWAKLPALRAALTRHELAVWIDADCIVLDHECDVADYLPAGSFQAIATDDRFRNDERQTCIWALRAGREAERFLRSVWQLRTGDESAWDQTTVNHLLGVSADDLAGTAALPARFGNCAGEHLDPAIQHAGDQAGPYHERAKLLDPRNLPRAVELLERARALISAPEAWLDGTHRGNVTACATTREGAPVSPGDQRAVRFCAVGAIGRAAGCEPQVDETEIAALSPAMEEAGRIADRLLGAAADGRWIGLVNDDETHAAVLATFDRAIELGRARLLAVRPGPASC